MSRIGFIGTGHIAAPMVRFLAARGHQITVSERNQDTASALQASHGVAVAGNQDLLDSSDIVFLCLRPKAAPAVLNDLRFAEGQQVISVMAGLSLAELSRLCAPVTDLNLTIPLGFLEHGGCPLPACPGAELLTELFAPENPVFEVADEMAFNQHFAVCAFVPGVLDLMATASDWLAAQTGSRENAGFYVRHLLSGFLSTMSDSGSDTLRQERDALATQGTLSLQMTTALRAGGAHVTLEEALTTIGNRLRGE